jgi:hypothetical protein
MKKKRFIILFFSLLLFAPSLAVSDCTDLGMATSTYVENERTIIFYRQNTPLAKVLLGDDANCTVNPSSNIRLSKSYVCDSDSLFIDGQVCPIMTLTLGSTGQ